MATERRGFVLLLLNCMPSQSACHINVFQNFEMERNCFSAYNYRRRDFIVISISVFCHFFRCVKWHDIKHVFTISRHKITHTDQVVKRSCEL